MKTTLGGDRLGSGNKQEISFRNYERSTHDMGYVWRSTMASGTLVPFINEIGLPGDTFDIDLNAEVLTHPTIGPLFGSYKLQLDVFSIPMRLYNAGLHMNQVGIGMNMEKVIFPQIKVKGKQFTRLDNLDNCQVNTSSLLRYLGISGLGRSTDDPNIATRRFNAQAIIGYWDVYKNYYANKQEEIGMYIHNNLEPLSDVLSKVKWYGANGAENVIENYDNIAPDGSNTAQIDLTPNNNTVIHLEFDDLTEEFEVDRFVFEVYGTGIEPHYLKARDIMEHWDFNPIQNIIIGHGLIQGSWYQDNILVKCYRLNADPIGDFRPRIERFRLTNIDDLRRSILTQAESSPFIIDDHTPAPYGSCLKYTSSPSEGNHFSLTSSQEGLGLKTYQSDIYNNWINNTYVAGGGMGSSVNGIAQISAVNVIDDKVYIDELNIKKKIYDMLNRIAISGGTYDDWLDSVYTHDRYKQVQNPVYHGGLSKEIVFQEVISNSATESEPLGTLAGRGVMSGKNKGGRLRIMVDEPSIIMGIVSITPRIDYSQGNKWHMSLKTMNDLHKPALDGIGFQNLMSDEIAYFNSSTSDAGHNSRVVGKVPAWINYMTNVNRNYGNFADRKQQMYMTLNRRYEHEWNISEVPYIKDLTTYIDPSKFNHIFADTRIDAQNFWTQIRVGMIARRKMSAKIIPNL